MPTNRQKGTTDNLASPVDDPEALLRARNTERRRLAKNAKNATFGPSRTPPATDTTMPTELPSPFLNPMNPPELPYTPGAFSNPRGSTSQDNSTTGGLALPTVPKPDEQLTTKLVRLPLASQHASSVQSVADRQALAAERQSHQERMAQFERASNERMAQFEQAILRLS
ncbi:hypothetical protein VP01_6840g1, partial [Puccinia sorghi]